MFGAFQEANCSARRGGGGIGEYLRRTSGSRSSGPSSSRSGGIRPIVGGRSYIISRVSLLYMYIYIYILEHLHCIIFKYSFYFHLI